MTFGFRRIPGRALAKIEQAEADDKNKRDAAGDPARVNEQRLRDAFRGHADRKEKNK